MKAVVFLLFLCTASLTRAQNGVENVRFLLWTRQNPNAFQILSIGDAAALSRSNYVATKNTKVYAHGWTMSGFDTTATNLRDAFLQKEDCNFISVDWQDAAGYANYYVSASNTLPVGNLMGDLVNFLLAHGSSLTRFHYVGFSLGAQVVGNAGAQTTGRVPRITGLDPAYPGFSMEDPSTRLDTTDAAFVDIIHTNSNTLVDGGLSFPFSIGHVDFWPNGGSKQVGCADSGPNLIDLAQGCSHGRAPIYFTESINSNTGFRGTSCSSYANFQSGSCNNNAKALMGYPVPTTTRGDYYLNTNSAAPFALG